MNRLQDITGPYGFTQTHIPQLIELATDPTLYSSIDDLLCTAAFNALEVLSYLQVLYFFRDKFNLL